MPTYDYACEACGNRFEKIQSMKDAAVKKCPKCGKLKVKRLIGSGAGFIFKGSGFYQTDYRSKSYQEGAKNESSSPKKTSEPSSGSCGGGKCAEGTPAPKKKDKD